MSASVARSNQAKNWFKPGVGGNPAGRPKGIENKLNKSIKDMILTALNDVGGAEYLAEQAHKNPVAFMGLVGKVLPIQLANAEGSSALVVDFRWADAPPTIEAAPVVSHETDAVDTPVDTPEITFQSDETP